MLFLSMGLRQGSGLCSSSFRKYPRTEGTNQNRHWNHHPWHAEWTRLSCWCLWNHKWCTYRAPVRYVTKTWSVALLNKKSILLSQVYCVWQVVKTPTIILNNPVYYCILLRQACKFSNSLIEKKRRVFVMCCVWFSEDGAGYSEVKGRVYYTLNIQENLLWCIA